MVSQSGRALGDRPKVDRCFDADLAQDVDQAPRSLGLPFSVWSCEDLARYESEHRGHASVSAETVRRHLQKLGFRIVRPVQSIGSPDPEYEEKARQLSDLQAQARRGEITLLYEDEVDLNLLPGVIGCWTRRGSQKKVPTPGKNEKRYGFGAVDYGTGHLVRRIEEHKRSDGFCALVEQLVERYTGTGVGVGAEDNGRSGRADPARARKVVLVVDNYIIHKSKKTEAVLERYADRLEVFRLPTYSPHLNPIEWLWRYLHRRVTHNHLFDTIQEVLLAVDDFFDELAAVPERVLSVIGALQHVGAALVPKNLWGAI